MTIEQLIGESWAEALRSEFEQDYMRRILRIVKKERQNFKVFPEGNAIFNAFTTTPLEDVSVVILGQDPYHTYDYKIKEPAAHGLAFSVTDEYANSSGAPPSLRNILKELENDIGQTAPWDFTPSTDLTRWAEQGVLLLNTALTVREGQAGSHADIGWQRFTKAALEAVTKLSHPVCYIAWGNYAQNIVENLEGFDVTSDRYLYSPHPSPLSAHRGFFNQNHFSKCNTFLEEIGRKPINWT